METQDKILNTLRTIALDVLAAMYARGGVSPGECDVGEDDIVMFDASSDAIIEWYCDLEYRCGYDVADFRAACVDYCIVRDGDPEASEVLTHHGFV